MERKDRWEETAAGRRPRGAGTRLTGMLQSVRNLRIAIRQLRQTPGFTLAAVLTLALGIGATTAIFSLVQGILLRPLPFRDADRLVLVGDHLGGRPGISVTAREIGIYTSAAGAFSSMGGFATASYEVSGGAQPEEVNAARVTSSVFPTLGVPPAMGRTFSAQEDTSGQPVAVISHALWADRYASDPGVLGKTIVLDRKTYSIVGVMPRGFEFPLQPGRLDQTQLWVPLSLSREELDEQHEGYWGYRLVARLKRGITVAQAARDADRVATLVMAGFPASQSAIHIRGDARLLRDDLVSGTRPLLRTLFLAVGIVLVIACANVSGLLLVRAIRRRREYALRVALGAGAAAVIREALLESLLLSLAGGALGLALAAGGIRGVVHLLPESMPRITAISIDASVALFALLLAVASGALCAVAPGFAALRTNLNESLKESAHTGTGSARHAWLRSALVVAEIGVAMVLLTVSAALLRSFEKMQAVDPGYRSDHVLVASYQLPGRQYATDASVETFDREAMERLSRKPGVAAAGMTNSLPGAGAFPMGAYTIEGAEQGWKLQFAAFAMTYGDYFQAMRIPLIEGRYFTRDDNQNAPLVLIVNESMARHCWPGRSAIGKRMHIGNPRKGLPWATVVGVVADTKLGSRDEPGNDQWYMPAEQPSIIFGSQNSAKLTLPAGGYLTVRAALPPETMAETLRATIAEIDPLLALRQVQPMDAVVANVESPRRFNTGLIGGFAVAALLLAITGIYAVVAFSVSLRTQEIAVRMALGAQRERIARLVLASGAKLAFVGCAIGVFGSLAAARLVNSLLFEVSATDPALYASAAAVMIFVALAASGLPALRAASVDPIKALRQN